MPDSLRPRYHFTPPAQWMNDPNGLVYCSGEYHLFYQHHPDSADWGPMHWGHAISRDLIQWEHLPIALYPDEHGLIFSGSAVVDWQNSASFGAQALVAIFTYHKNHFETQNLAYSTDRGRTWTKYAGNPVLSPPEDVVNFRDPKVFWHADHWVMVLAAGDAVRFYTSPNLKNWLASGSFGPGFGSTEGVWETPDLFQLPVSGGETRWVLTVGVGAGGPAGGSAAQYFIGQFDGWTFTSENPPETVLWMDYGADFYAPQSWSDEPNKRRILLGWLANWQYAALVPTESWRGAFSLPRELALGATTGGLRLTQRPLAGLKTLRKPLFHQKNILLAPGDNPLAKIYGDCLEIEAELAPFAARFGFRLRVGADEETVITCDRAAQTISVNRRRSGQVSFKDGFAATHSAPLVMSETIQLRIFLDRCSIEVFANDGQVVLTESIFPSPASLGLAIFTECGSLQVNALAVYEILAAPLQETS